MKKLSETAAKIELGVKVCCRCGEEKAFSSFSNDKSRKDGKNPRCKTCDAEYFANRSETTKQREKERQKSGRYNDYYHNFRQNHKDETREYNKSYKKLKKDKVLGIEAKRRAKKLNATPNWLNKSQLAQIEAVYSHARDCQIVTGEAYHVDHIIPLQGRNVCGLHVPWNLQVLPAEVNLRKNNRYEETQ